MTIHESSEPPHPRSFSKKKAAIPWVALATGLFGLALGVAAGVYLAWNRAQLIAGEQAHATQAALVQAHQDRVHAQLQADALTGQLVVEESTRKSLETMLQSVQEELGQARDQLAFFDQLFPPGPSGTVSIRALEIELADHALQYRVLLTRNTANASSTFTGSMQFKATGMQNGKEVTLPLSPVRPEGASETADDTGGESSLSLKFDRFQRSVGLLALPEDFIPRDITLSIIEGSSVRVTRRSSLPIAQ
jgi:hypothetical protein